MQIPTGTTEVKRTTVPFMDDEDDTIGDLADLLVTIAQIIIFVVDYRYHMIVHIVIR